jgi:hypothetical protein
MTDDQIHVEVYKCCKTSRRYIMKKYEITNVKVKPIETIVNICELLSEV